MSTTNPLFTVVFRYGGTENFSWHRTLSMTKAQADLALAEVRQMGYAAHIEEYSMSMAIGLPETYAIGAGSGPLDPEDHYEFEDREEVRAMGRMMESSDDWKNEDGPFPPDNLGEWEPND